MQMHVEAPETTTLENIVIKGEIAQYGHLANPFATVFTFIFSIYTILLFYIDFPFLCLDQGQYIHGPCLDQGCRTTLHPFLDL